MRPPAVAADAERDHVRVLEQQQRVANRPRAPLVDKRALQRERLGIRHEAEMFNS